MQTLIMIVLAAVIVNILISIFRKLKVDSDPDQIISPLKTELDRMAAALKSDNSGSRMELNAQLSSFKDELNRVLLDNRAELNGTLEKFRQSIEARLSEFSGSLSTSSEGIVKKQDEIRRETELKLSSFQTTLNSALTTLNESIQNKFREFGNQQRSDATLTLSKHDEIKTATDLKLESIRKTVEERLEKLQEANGIKLDEMRKTVDEKLQSTLNTRLTESFKQVSEQLDKVHLGLGTMTSLANDVGGLKKVLTNVKTRGMIGEIQLESLLNSVLSPDQYEMNVQIKNNSQERVEFAIKLPGRDENNKAVYLPIDSKFPDAAYQKLLKAYDEADTPGITIARKELETAIKKEAKSIKDKYIDPPATTEWGILFLPFEGLYAEVLQNSELVHTLQSEFHIMLTGPTTLGAFINSLQMGFKTLAIQKSSSEVWQLLGAVKTQFNTFGEVLDAAQKKIRGAGDDIEKLVGTRTRKIQAQLRKVESLPIQSSGSLQDISGLLDTDTGDEDD